MTGADGHRLPRTVSPRRYQLAITPDLAEATFAGTERVEIEVHEPVEVIVLNAAELSVEQARLLPAGRKPEPVSGSGTGDGPSGPQAGPGTGAIDAAVEIDAEEERLTLTLAEPAPPGRWELELSFSGRINDKLAGFYRSTFTDAGSGVGPGSTRVIAATQFEATDARRAFPCWDEPDRKAVFSVTLVVPEELTAVSNTAPVEEVPAGAGKRRVRFADTMPMSTYLVAWVVGPMEATSPLQVNGVPLRVVHVPGKGHLTAFALEVGSHALRFFSDWFGLPYPSDKLDLIALPDFAFGAMENLGAVTFRESALLVDPERASRLELERVADVVCHEIAHMWFGDLVTMAWWNGLWLNEAFATFMEVLCVDAFRPGWRRWVSFGRSRAAALATDGLASTRPIEYPVQRPSDAEGMFDVLTYEKGASVLRMLERYLPAGQFQDGIRRYLTAHRHANAETGDLWEAIEAASEEPVRSTMDTWIYQGGYPLVEVAAEGAGVVLRQTPFRYRPAARSQPAGGEPGGGEPGGGEPGRDAIGSDWQVPILLRAGLAGGETVERRVMLGPGRATVELPGPPAWVVANARGSGFYRVAYRGDLLDRLTAGLTRLGPLERFNLVADTWATVLAGSTPPSQLVGLLSLACPAETDPDVWSLVASIVSFLDRVVPEEDRQAVAAFDRRLAGPALARVGWSPGPEESERQGTLRAALVTSLGTVGADPEVRARAARLHLEALAGQATLVPDLARAVVSVVAATGTAPEYETFLQRYRDPSTPQEELRYLYALADFEDPALVARTLDLAVTEVRTQNAPYLISRLLANRAGGAAAWAFVTARWEDLLARLPDNTIPRMLDGLSTLVRPELAASVGAFFADHRLASGQRTLEQTLERLDVNLAFAQREGAGLAACLAADQGR